MDNGLNELDLANSLIEDLMCIITDRDEEISELYETIEYMQRCHEDSEEMLYDQILSIND